MGCMAKILERTLALELSCDCFLASLHGFSFPFSVTGETVECSDFLYLGGLSILQNNVRMFAPKAV